MEIELPMTNHTAPTVSDVTLETLIAEEPEEFSIRAAASVPPPFPIRKPRVRAFD